MIYGENFFSEFTLKIRIIRDNIVFRILCKFLSLIKITIKYKISLINFTEVHGKNL